VDTREDSLTHAATPAPLPRRLWSLPGRRVRTTRAEAVGRLGKRQVRSLHTSRRPTPDTHHGAGNRPRRAP
jgi:hypothetical protein